MNEKKSTPRPEDPTGRDSALAQALTLLDQVWYQGSFSSTHLPGSVDQQEGLSQIIYEIMAVQGFVQAVAKGDLSFSLMAKGLIAADVKGLQNALRQLTWQTKRIAEGDFDQRVDFMEEFSLFFNAVTQDLGEKHDQLKRVAKELSQINTNLKKEMEERKQIESELKRYHELLENLSVTDGLTGLANRRRLDSFLVNEWRRAIRSKGPISFILMDIDFFKAFNDHYGHLAGDDCLRQVALGLMQVIQRPGDLLARYGGEEFSCVLPDTDVKGAMAVGRQIQERMKSLQILHGYSSVSDLITLSLGVATIIPFVEQNPSDLIQRADELLYEAKRRGRNQIRIWPEGMI